MSHGENYRVAGSGLGQRKGRGKHCCSDPRDLRDGIPGELEKRSEYK